MVDLVNAMFNYYDQTEDSYFNIVIDIVVFKYYYPYPLRL